jgi:hypothetical protein
MLLGYTAKKGYVTNRKTIVLNCGRADAALFPIPEFLSLCHFKTNGACLPSDEIPHSYSSFLIVLDSSEIAFHFSQKKLRSPSMYSI